jgi:hypothetical protein
MGIRNPDANGNGKVKQLRARQEQHMLPDPNTLSNHIKQEALLLQVQGDQRSGMAAPLGTTPAHAPGPPVAVV